MHRHRLALLSLCLITIFCLQACAASGAADETPTAAPERLVRVEADGEAQTVRTPLTSPLAILASLGLSLSPGDAVWADGVLLDPAASGRVTSPHDIVVRRALTVSVVDAGAASEIHIAARTVGEALWRAGYRLHRADEVEPGLEAPLTSPLTITIHRSRLVAIQADGQILAARTRGETVGEVLGDWGLALVGEDYSIPAPDQPLPEDGVVRVVRVREEVLTAQETVPYETLFQAMPDQEIDTVTTLQAGVAGLRQRRVRVRY
ncbi:MAG TPA: ubiquitin-like domain-containing protein, partial [Anaerolineales bacterium]|nr:ubiquitin-like domain-containing protein [Anaerolineales bacterium]